MQRVSSSPGLAPTALRNQTAPLASQRPPHSRGTVSIVVGGIGSQGQKPQTAPHRKGGSRGMTPSSSVPSRLGKGKGRAAVASVTLTSHLLPPVGGDERRSVSKHLGMFKLGSRAPARHHDALSAGSSSQLTGTLFSASSPDKAHWDLATELGGAEPAPVSMLPRRGFATGWKVARSDRAAKFVDRSMQESRSADAIALAKVHKDHSLRARRAWDDERMTDCVKHLNIALDSCPSDEMLLRLRSKARSRAGMLDDALEDAGRAVASNPGNPFNHRAHGLCLQAKKMLPEAGTAYMQAMKRGMPGSSDELGFNGLLSTIQRERRYFGDVRPAHRKAFNSLFLARTPSRCNIFDPEKTLEEGDVAAEDLELPEPPVLELVKANENSLTVRWLPNQSEDQAHMTIYSFELQMAIYDVRWEADRHDFFDGFCEYVRLQEASSDVTEMTIENLHSDSKVSLRVRARGYSGYGDFNELICSTKPPPSHQVEALPLPKKWLLVDVNDLVPQHVLEVGGVPKQFYKELASCFEPNVRTIKRLFAGWCQVGLVGHKTKKGEMGRQQFQRFCKEVGLLPGGNSGMDKRSGANLIDGNEVDRIFARSNRDIGENATRDANKHISQLLGIDGARLRELAAEVHKEVLENDDCPDDEDDELREQLRPIFDRFDEDRSGSVSTAEMGKIFKAMKVATTPEQMKNMMAEADPDGSGEVDFEEFVAVLKKQMAEGGSQLAAFVNANAEDDGGMNSMVVYEFVHALIRLAWKCYDKPATGIGYRLNSLLEKSVIPGSSHFIQSEDPMEAELASRRVGAITDYYAKDLREIFNVFCGTDVSLDGQAHLDSMSFAELVFMIKQCELIDSNLTITKLTAIFNKVNQGAADDGEKDDDSQELSLSEFKSLMARVADCKIPKDRRGGEPFEYTWHSFLQLIFLPKIKKVIKDMKKGVGKKTING